MEYMGPDQQTSGPPPIETGASVVQIGPEQQAAPDLRVTMLGVMDQLVDKNVELGGKLSHSMGTGEDIIYVFNHPYTERIVQEDGTSKQVEELVVVTRDGFKLIQIDKGATTPDGRSDLKGTILELIDSATVARGTETHDIGWKDGKLSFGKKKFAEFGYQLGIYGLQTDGGGPLIKGVRLVENIDPETVAKIVRLNKETAEQEWGRQQEEAQGIANNIQAAQKVNEILG